MIDDAQRARAHPRGPRSPRREGQGRAVLPEKDVLRGREPRRVAHRRRRPFDSVFLRVPREVLETAMRATSATSRSRPGRRPRQRVPGGAQRRPERSEAIVRGHERAPRRLADAAFFYDEDLKKAAWRAGSSGSRPSCSRRSLGTLAAKVERIERSGSCSPRLPGRVPTRGLGGRAAHLCKADLVSHAVVEFPRCRASWALLFLAADEEARCRSRPSLEHYRPRFAGDELPGTLPGMLVVGRRQRWTRSAASSPSGCPHGILAPYALRRAAIGVLQISLDGSAAQHP